MAARRARRNGLSSADPAQRSASVNPTADVLRWQPPAATRVAGPDGGVGPVFECSTWSMPAPQALLGVGSVALPYAAVRRYSGPVADLVADAHSRTPQIAAPMFRFNNPDALLMSLFDGAHFLGARRRERTVMVASARRFRDQAPDFSTEMLQAFFVSPAFAPMNLVSAPVSLPKRLLQLLGRRCP
ncbi:hypothetical protein LY15_003061 [Prauserella flava]|nr:hypothetical protein [Prauserella flava]